MTLQEVGAFSISINYSFGFSDGTNSRARAIHMNNRSATTQCAEYSDNAVFLGINASATILVKATHTAFTSDGITINWTTNDSRSFPISVLLIGGSDVTDIAVGDFAAPTSTGSKTVSDAAMITPPGIVLLLGHGNTSLGNGHTLGMDMSIGAAVSSSARFCLANKTFTSTSTDQSGVTLFTNSCITRYDDTVSTVTINYQADFTAFTSNGFTLNFTTAPAAGNLISYMMIGGTSTCKFAIQNTAQATATGAQSFTGAGFLPVATMMFGHDYATVNTIVKTNNIPYSIGAASDASAAAAHAISQVHGSAQTNCEYVNTSAVFSAVNAADIAASSTVLDECTLTSLDADGSTVNWTTNNGVAAIIAIIYFGEFVSVTPPPTPTGPGLAVFTQGGEFG